MADISAKVKALIDSVRGKLTSAMPATPSGRPVDQRLRGYQLYAKEAQVMGEQPMPYEQWISQQSPDIGGM
jgi:hypothetical protein